MNKPRLVSMQKRWGMYSPAMRYFMIAGYDAIEFMDKSVAVYHGDTWCLYQPKSGFEDSHAYDFIMMTHEVKTWQPTPCTYHPLNIEERDGEFYLLHNHVILDQASTLALIQKKWAEWLEKL